VMLVPKNKTVLGSGTAAARPEAKPNSKRQPNTKRTMILSASELY
jgi:hypothetical protein